MNKFIDTIQTQIARQNETIFHDGHYVSPSGVNIYMPNKKKIVEGTRYYSECFSVVDKPSYNAPTSYNIVEGDAVKTAKSLMEQGLKPIVLSFANGYYPCGLYEEGGKGREEHICRVSTLSCSLKHLEKSVPSAYPMDINFGGIYSKVIVFREDKEHKYRLLEHPWEMSIVSVAALNLRGSYHHSRIVRNLEYAVHGEESMTAEGKAIMKNKIRTIYRIAIDNGHDSIILGAWGCGAYKQRPQLIGRMFREVLDEQEFRRKFKEVHSVIEDHKQYVQYVRSIEGNERFKCTDRPAYFCFKVGNDNIWGAEYPGDSVETLAKEKLMNALEFGITHFIDLTEEGELPPYKHLLPKDGSVCYMRFPIKDARSPKNVESVSKLIKMMEDILKDSKAKIYLHCWGGVGRTGTISACWIAHKYGSDYSSVMSRLQNYWQTCLKSYSQPIPDHWSQKEFVKTYIAHERYEKSIETAKNIMVPLIIKYKEKYESLNEEELIDITYRQLYEKYVEGGYSSLWKTSKHKADDLQFLQQLIREEKKTKDLLQEIINML